MTTFVEPTQPIPRYSLAESSNRGNTLFDIAEAKDQFRYHRANFLTPHRKDYYFLCLVRKGHSRHWVDFTPYDLKPDTFYFSVPHQIQLKEKSKPMEGFLLSFTAEYLQLEENRRLQQLPIIQNPDNQHELKLTPDDVAFLDDLMRRVLSEFNAERDWRTSMLQSYLSVLLIYVSRLYTDQFRADEAAPDRVLLKKFQTCIERHYATHHQVADYARMLHLTPGHLNERVKQQSGKTAIEHIHERLVLEAKRLLLHTDFSIKELAYQLGFEDVAYFNRFFKRLTDSTPTAFRTLIREMYQ